MVLVHSKKGLLLLLVLLVLLSIGVFAVLNRTNIFPRATTQQAIATVKIDPGQIVTDPNGAAIHMSAQAFDANGNHVDGVRYQWGMSSTNSVGTIVQEAANDKLATFTPTSNTGQGDLWVRAFDTFGQSVTGSIPVYVGVAPTKTLQLSTEYVSLTADDFVIYANGKPYYMKPDPGTEVSVRSDPGSSRYTTLETSWYEGGVEMRLFIYFASDGEKWWATEIRTYNGIRYNPSQGQYPDWIYYTDGPYFNSPLGYPYRNTGTYTVNSSASNSIPGSISFTNLTLQAFYALTPTLLPTPTPPQTVSSIEFLIKFSGVNEGAAQGAGVTARFVRSDVNVVTPPIIFTHVGNGIYKATVGLSGSLTLPAGPGYTIILKGEKHVARKFCKQTGQTAPCTGNESMTFPSGTTIPVFDFTGLTLDPGDLPPQDGKADSSDFDVIKSMLSKPCSSLTDQDKKTTDLDYNGCIDISDVFLMRKTLETRYDEN